MWGLQDGIKAVVGKDSASCVIEHAEAASGKVLRSIRGSTVDCFEGLAAGSYPLFS
jgi:hypothetical protein